MKKLFLLVLITSVVGQAIALPGFKFTQDAINSGVSITRTKASQVGDHILRHKKKYASLTIAGCLTGGLIGIAAYKTEFFDPPLLANYIREGLKKIYGPHQGRLIYEKYWENYYFWQSNGYFKPGYFNQPIASTQDKIIIYLIAAYEYLDGWRR